MEMPATGLKGEVKLDKVIGRPKRDKEKHEKSPRYRERSLLRPVLIMPQETVFAEGTEESLLGET